MFLPVVSFHTMIQLVVTTVDWAMVLLMDAWPDSLVALIFWRIVKFPFHHTATPRDLTLQDCNVFQSLANSVYELIPLYVLVERSHRNNQLTASFWCQIIQTFFYTLTHWWIKPWLLSWTMTFKEDIWTLWFSLITLINLTNHCWESCGKSALLKYLSMN